MDEEQGLAAIVVTGLALYHSIYNMPADRVLAFFDAAPDSVVRAYTEMQQVLARLRRPA